MGSAHTTEEPVDTNLDNGAPITTAGTFVVASDRTVYAIRAWIPATNTGTWTFELWDVDVDDDPGPAAGSLLASEERDASEVTAGEWNRIPLTTPQAVVTTKAYRVARHSTSGRYVRTALAFNGASISNGGITLIESGTNPGGLYPGVLRNGTFREGAAGNYPGPSAFQQADYFGDIDDEDDAVPVDVELAGSLPAIVGAFTADAQSDAQLAGVLPAITGTFTADAVDDLALAGVLPAVIAAFTADAQSELALAGTLPAIVGTFALAGPASGTVPGVHTAGGRSATLTAAGRSGTLTAGGRP